MGKNMYENKYLPFKDLGFVIIFILTILLLFVSVFIMSTEGVVKVFTMLPYLIAFIFWSSYIYFKKGKKWSFIGGLIWSILVFALVFVISFKIYGDYKFEGSDLQNKTNELLGEYEIIKDEEYKATKNEPEIEKNLPTKVEQEFTSENLEIYRNEKYGFEFTYPQNYTIDIEDNKITIKELGSIYWPRLIVEKNLNGTILEDKIKEWSEYAYTDGHGEIMIGEKQSHWFTTTEMGAYFAFVVTKDYIYRFDTFGLWKRSEIVSTFKFID